MFSLARTTVESICLARALLMFEMRHHQCLLHDKSCALPVTTWIVLQSMVVIFQSSQDSWKAVVMEY